MTKKYTIINLFFLLVLLILNSSCLYAQQTRTVMGKITDGTNEELIGVTVRVQGTQLGAVSDLNGVYTIKNVPTGSVLIFSMVGFETFQQVIPASNQRKIKLDVILSEKVDELNEVMVEAESATNEKERLPITVAAIDVAKLQAETSDVNRVLDKVSGVRIRQSGGLGSNTNISINGMSGRAVRVYHDGIPIEFLGRGFSINFLSVNNLDRVEVYKGVMPIKIGTDALAGGINIVPKQYYEKNLSASFQIGSFGTYRAFINFTQPINANWFFNTHADFNYSDNSYTMEVENNTYNSFGIVSSDTIRVSRFHDAFRLLTVKTIIGYNNLDRGMLFYSTIVGSKGMKEIQHDARVGSVPIGQANLSLTGINWINKFSLDKDKWNLTLSSTHGYNMLGFNDFSGDIYDWNGVNITKKYPDIKKGNGAELSSSERKSNINDVTHFGRANFSYKIFKNTTLSINSMLGYQKQFGKDEFFRIGGKDPFETPSTLVKNINAVQLSQKLFNDKIDLSVFSKHYYYSNRAVDRLLSGVKKVQIAEASNDFFGYSAAMKYNILDDLFIRASAEKAARIPDRFEFFGNLTTVKPNIYLKPERSNNFNIGAKFSRLKFLNIELNYFIRKTFDRVYLDLSIGNSSTYKNRDKTKSSGIEATLKGNLFNDRFTYSYQITSQRVIVDSYVDISDKSTLGSLIPNIPTFFQNIQLSYSFPNTFKQNDKLKVTWFTNHIEEFPFVQEGGVRNDENWIPVQLISDVGLLYHFANEKLSMNLSINNLFDSDAFDFISVPKPGINYQFKVNYKLY